MLEEKIVNELSEKMQEGYYWAEKNKSISACSKWADVWKLVLTTMKLDKYDSIEELDDDFVEIIDCSNGFSDQTILNWASDYEKELGISMGYDISFAEKRIEYCSEYIKLSNDIDGINYFNMKSSIAETYFFIGNKEKGDELFKKYLEEKPIWGWGWIGWSNCYRLIDNKDSEKAIKILKQALETKNLEDRVDVQERLMDLYKELGMSKEAEEIVINEEQKDNLVVKSKYAISDFKDGINIKELISKIEYNSGIFPENELRQLIENIEKTTPALLSILEYTRDNIDKIASDDDYFAHMFATYLLAQFREYKAYKLIFEILMNIGDLADDIYGDAITEDMGRILASVCNNDISLIKQLIEDSNVYEYIRSAAINSLTVLVVRNEIKRDEIIKYFRSLYESKLERDYSYVWTSLALNTHRIYPEELMDEVKKAFKEDLIDNWSIGIDSFDEELKVGREVALKKIEDYKQFTFIGDTIKEFKHWACFNNSNKEVKGNYDYVNKKADNIYKPKVGRNDLCPCGSGKKYKKCCLNK
ncbi:MAG: DUF1186 domain-containing protein [Clostridiales bacterium]